jgi:general stress protein 26
MTPEQALDRVAELLSENPNYVLATVDMSNAPQMRWMGAIVRDPGHPHVFYMASASRARKVAQLLANPAAQLLLNTPDFACVGTVAGHATMEMDQAVKNRVWDSIPQATQYFSGPEGEDFGVIRFAVTHIEVLCLGSSHEPICVDIPA